MAKAPDEHKNAKTLHRAQMKLQFLTAAARAELSESWE